jgi:hypothetical protein
VPGRCHSFTDGLIPNFKGALCGTSHCGKFCFLLMSTLLHQSVTAALLESNPTSKPRETLKVFDDGSIAQHAVLCISRLSRSSEVCKALCDRDTLTSLVNCITFGMLKPVAEFAVSALIDLSTQRPATRKELEQLGAIEATTAMLSNNMSMAKNEKCIFFLSVLSLNSHFHRDRIRQAGAIKHIVEKLNEATPGDYVSKTALSCLLNLCASNLTNKLEVSKAGGVAAILRCLSASNRRKVSEIALSLVSSLCVGNDTNDAIIGQLGGIPPIVSLLASGLDNPLMIKATTAAMHLLRDDSHNKITFCNCGGILKLLHISRSLGKELVTSAVVEKALLAMSNACYNCHEARSVAVSEGAGLVAARLVFDQWSDKPLFKAAIALCAHLAHDRSNVSALYELGVVDALVFYILREFGGKRSEDSRWWFSALKSIVADHQLSQDAVEDGGGR